MNTIDEAKSYLRSNWEKGAVCPCCKQIVKLWRHKINSQMAVCLIKLYSISYNENKEWVHILNEIKPSNRMYSLARWWGLLEPREFIGHEDKKSNGYWKITKKGIDFIQGAIVIPKYAFLFNNKLFRFSEEKVTIQNCLGSKFSYSELMEGLSFSKEDSGQQSLL